MAKRGDQTKADIVSCAQRLFYERGFDATSFSAIVDASGLFRGNIYHYFKAKDDILRAVVERHLEEFGDLLHAWEAQSPDARGRLALFLDMIAARSPALIQFGCPIGSLNSELGKEHGALHENGRRLFDLFRDWLTARFRELGLGEKSPAMAMHLLARAQGIVLLAQAYGDADFLAAEIAALKTWLTELPPAP